MNNTSAGSGSAIPLVPMNNNHHHHQQASVPPPSPPLPNPPPSDLVDAGSINHPSTSSSHATPVNQQQQPNHTIVSIPPPTVSPPTPPTLQPNLPSLDLLQPGNRERYIDVGVPLYEAAIKGDWKAAKPILDEQLDLIRYAITENNETLLHVAASAESTKAVEEFVKNLVNLMEKKDLELQNENWNTALHLAAAAGNIETASTMIEKNPTLAEIPNKHNAMPLYMAALFAKPDMVRYLYGISNKMAGDFWKDDNRGWVLQKCVEADIFDVAMQIVNDCPKLCDNKRLLSDVLLALAQKPKAFKRTKAPVISRILNSIFAMFHVKLWSMEKEREAVQLLRIIWKKIAKMPKDKIDDIIRGSCITHTTKGGDQINLYPSRVLFLAAKMGNTRFIIELIRLYPDLIWKRDDKKKTIFHLAVKRRQVKTYKLLYEIGAMKDLITPISDKKGNNMLHMVAKSVKQNRFQNVSGVAFQMQSELLWFQEVEKMIPPNYGKRKNNDGKTPQDLFTKTHADLLKDGGEWMKNTAAQCMVVATLIATIVFAAAFTLPGGYNDNTGLPFFRKEPCLIIFVISDAVSLICSSTSVLIFLSILTSRYAERDFLESLPRKLVNGITALFLSIVTMMIAFSASFFVLYNKKVEWVPITITGLAGIPVILYVTLQHGLFRDVFKSAYRTRYLFKRSNRVLYY